MRDLRRRGDARRDDRAGRSAADAPGPARGGGARPDGVGRDPDEAGTLNLWRAASENKGGIDAVRDAIESGDVAALMAIDPEIVPFYCRECEASYCETHWRTWPEFDPEWPSWFEELRGVCPLGHERCIHD